MPDFRNTFFPVHEYRQPTCLITKPHGARVLVRLGSQTEEFTISGASFASRANACRASGLTIAQLLGHANNTQILPTYVRPLDENTKAVIDALDTARLSRPVKSSSVQ